MLHQLSQKIAVVFSKTGPAIYHSHHDLIRFWERAIKRAKLPMRMTQGFNPRPRIIFPHALGLGIRSMHEEVELELHERLETGHILDAIKSAAGDTLGIEKIIDLPPVKKSRQIISSSYRIEGWQNYTVRQLAEVAEKIPALPEIIVVRGAPNQERKMDIRPFIKILKADQDDLPVLSLTLVHTLTGSARPDEIASLAASMLDADKFTLAITKTDMALN